jgi:hypothetical protein
MIISENQKPTAEYVSVSSWERTLDPWHEDAFPIELSYAGTKGKRKSGWLGVDWVGNPIIFIPDGTEFPDV